MTLPARVRDQIRRWAHRLAPHALITWRLFRGLGSMRAQRAFVKRNLARRFSGQPDRLPATLRRGFEIVFVCRGNIMRSPLAEAVLRAGLAADTRSLVASAGISATPGTPADERARAFAETRGLSLAQHQAQSLDAALLRRADLLVALDRGIEAEILARHPPARTRTVLLGGVDSSGRYRGYDILDPVLAPDDETERVFRATEAGARALAKWLTDRVGPDSTPMSPHGTSLAD